MRGVVPRTYRAKRSTHEPGEHRRDRVRRGEHAVLRRLVDRSPPQISHRRPVSAGGTIERACYVLAAVMVTSGVVHLALAAVIGAPWSGPVSLRKAVTFGVSFGVLLALLTAVTRSTRSGPLLRRWLLGALALASVGEVLAATVLGWRRVTAQTVTAAPLDVALGRSGAVTGAVLVLALVGCALSTRPAPDTPTSMRLAVLAGHLGLLVGSAIGVTMIVRSVIAADDAAEVVITSGGGVSLVPAHLLALSGVVVLPGLARTLTKSRLTERRRVAAVALAVAGQAVLTGVVAVEALAGIDPLAPVQAPLPPTVLAATGAVALLAAATWTAVSRVRGR
jgi:hypothetical protein